MITFQAQQSARQRHPVQPLCFAVLLAAALYLQSACAGERVVFGNIPPSTFYFTTVVQHRGPGSGGWQAAQVLISMAQREAAHASDRAARDVMQNRAKPTATACELFRNRMEYYLRDEEIGTIPGARVSKFRA